MASPAHRSYPERCLKIPAAQTDNRVYEQRYPEIAHVGELPNQGRLQPSSRESSGARVHATGRRETRQDVRKGSTEARVAIRTGVQRRSAGSKSTASPGKRSPHFMALPSCTANGTTWRATRRLSAPISAPRTWWLLLVLLWRRRRRCPRIRIDQHATTARSLDHKRRGVSRFNSPVG
jgi:hypothetical protein